MTPERFIVQASIDVAVTIRLTYTEMQALDALAGYGTDEFLKVFYERMGESYLRPHEKGLRSLFDAVRREFPSVAKSTRDASDAFTRKGRGEPQ